MTKVVLLLVFVTTSVASGATIDQDGPAVETNYGIVRGASEVYDGRPYDVFRGIPFGSSTDGENRFTVAEQPDPWQDELEAQEFKPYCKQLITPFYGLLGMKTVDDEDCLFLNIYVPNGVDVKRDANIPVLFFIYGGAFYIGASDMYPAEDLALNTNSIVVTFNYRLAALGFLSTGNDNSPGNFGLWDSYMALKWVSENIASFGGDSSRVTVMGQSAGAAAASHLAISPYTNGLFQRYVPVSGSSTSFFASTSNLPQTVRNTALVLGCNIFNQEAMIACLKEKSSTALDLIGLAAPLVLGSTVPNWVPVVDGDLVPEHPRDLISQGSNSHLDILTGSTRHDAAGFVYLNFLGYPIGDRLNIARNKGLMMSILSLLMSPAEDPDYLVDLVLGQYPDLESDDELARTKAAVKAVTDFAFFAPSHYEASQHVSSGSGSTYMYEFAYKQSFLFYEEWVQGNHVDDLHSIFGPVFLKDYREGLLGTEWNEDDKTVSTNIQGYLANFLATGNPNEGPFSVPVSWPEYGEDRQYIVQQPDFTVTSPSEEQSDTINFWNDFYDQVKPSATVKTSESVERLITLLRPHLQEFLRSYQHFTEKPDDFLPFIQNAVRDLIDSY